MTESASLKLFPGRTAQADTERSDLSLNLCAFVSQRQVPTADNKRCVAIGIMVGTPMVADLIKKGSIMEIKEVMEESDNAGMQTFDSALVKLYQEGLISKEIAIKNADSENNVRLKIDLAAGGQRGKPEAGSSVSRENSGRFGGLSLVTKEVEDDKADNAGNA